MSGRSEASSPGSSWTNRTGMEFLWAPPGEFLMGGADEEAAADEGPVHAVGIAEGFWLGKYPVTQGEWTAVMGVNPSRFQGGPDAGRRPVESVSFEDCRDFLARLSELDGRRHRLASEAEWEYAARAGTTGARYGEVARVAWFDGNAEGSTHAVGGKEPNPWGFHDTLGNVWEWVEDLWHEGYRGAPGRGEAWLEGEERERVLRGGAWNNSDFRARAAYRNWDVPEFRVDCNGLRVVVEGLPAGRR